MSSFSTCVSVPEILLTLADPVRLSYQDSISSGLHPRISPVQTQVDRETDDEPDDTSSRIPYSFKAMLMC